MSIAHNGDTLPPFGMTRLRILLADDHQLMREGLRMIVNAQTTSMEVVGEAIDGAAAVVLTRELHPDVVVMDLSMPRLGGLQATEAVRQICPDAKVLVLTRHADHAFVQQLLQAGARGYVLKRSASEELVRAITHVAAGQTYIDPAVTGVVIRSTPGGPPPHRPPAGAVLSNREEDVLRLVASGLLSKEIAARLGISIKTVDTHKANAMRKLELGSRVDIVRYAVMRGWLQDV
jgi:two-component system, NarL family, response regulator NreC